MDMNLLLLVIVMLPTAAKADRAPGAAGPIDPIVAGRKALAPWSGYPWYDRKADGLRPVEMPQEREPAKWNPQPSSSLLTVLTWTVLVVVLLVIIGLLLWAFWDRTPRITPDATPSQDDEMQRLKSLPFPLVADRSNLLQEARRYYQAGDYRQAIIYLFSYQLIEMDKRRIIRLSKGKTNRQYLREARARPQLASLVEQTMVMFEDVFFGNCPLGQQRFDRCWSRLDEFTQLAKAE
jgi:hypothetical protein